MLDINLIRERPQIIREALKNAKWTHPGRHHPDAG